MYGHYTNLNTSNQFGPDEILFDPLKSPAHPSEAEFVVESLALSHFSIQTHLALENNQSFQFTDDGHHVPAL